MKRVGPLLVAVVVLASSVGCGLVAKHVFFANPKVQHILATSKPDRSLTQPGHVETIGTNAVRITVLYVSGNPYEMGFQHGQLLAEQVRAAIRDVETGALELLPKAIRNSTLLSESDKRTVVACQCA